MVIFNIDIYMAPFNYCLTIASNLHFGIQAPHLIHTAWSMVWTSLTLPEMQLTGQMRAQRVQPTHFSGTITISRRLVHTPEGHFLSTTCALYSSTKVFIVERTGLGMVCPSPQRAVSLMVTARVFNLSRSSGTP